MIPFCILAIENDDDREFMAGLFLRYQRLLYNEIYEILNNPWNTEDILQATLVKLIDKIPELRKKEETKLGELYGCGYAKQYIQFSACPKEICAGLIRRI